MDPASNNRLRQSENGGSPPGKVEPFGLTDLRRAFAHPFKFRPSLIFGGLMFALFAIGRSISGLGGYFYAGVSILCVILAGTLAFCILAKTVDNFAKGRLESDFMPGGENFSLLDDVVHPYFLSVGVYLTSFGPFILVAAVGAYLIASAASDQLNKYNQELAQLPGTHYYSPDRTAVQSKEVREVLERNKLQNERRSAGYESSGRPEHLNLSVEHQEQPKAGVPDLPPAPENITGNTVTAILRLPAPLVVVGALAFLWGLFYFPAACAVATRSKSFLATVTPAVGLNGIKRFGFDYVKILLMELLLFVAALAAITAVSLLFFPFNLHSIGNVPAAAVGSFFVFYFFVVFSCILGYALFKSADRLKLRR